MTLVVPQSGRTVFRSFEIRQEIPYRNALDRQTDRFGLITDNKSSVSGTNFERKLCRPVLPQIGFPGLVSVRPSYEEILIANDNRSAGPEFGVRLSSESSNEGRNDRHAKGLYRLLQDP